MKARSTFDDLPLNVVLPVLAIVIVLGTGLRFFRLDSGLWYDEIKTLVDAVRPPLGHILTSLAGDNDHPLFSVLAHLSIEAFGESAWSVRLPAAIAGIATIPVLYIFGTRITGRFEALAAAALLALSYHHVWFSQNARGYTLLLLWTLIATHLILVALEHDRRRVYVWYGLVAALGTYTHLTMVFVVVSHALVVMVGLLRDPARRARAGAWANPVLGFGLAALLTLLLYAPLLMNVETAPQPEPAGPRVATGVDWALLEFLRQLEVGFAATSAGALGVLFFAAGCWSYLRQSRTVLAVALLPAVLTFAAPLILERPIRPRFFFFLGGFVLLIVVRGAVVVGAWIARTLMPAAPPQMIPLGLLAIMAVVSALALPAGYRYPKQDYQGALDYVEGAAGEAPIVVAGGGAAVPYQRYYERPWQRLGSDDELEALIRDHGIVWLLYSLPSYIEAYEPELWEAIRVNCSLRRTFPGTVGDGDLTVQVCGAG